MQVADKPVRTRRDKAERVLSGERIVKYIHKRLTTSPEG